MRAECLGPSRQEAGLKSGPYVFLSGRSAGRGVTPSTLVIIMVLGTKQWKEPPRRVLGTCRQQTPFSIAWQKTARASSEIPTSCRMTATLRMHLLPGRKPFWQEERQWPTHVADIDDSNDSTLLKDADEAQAAAAAAGGEERPPVIRLLKPTKLF